MSRTPREPIFDAELNAWRVPLTRGAFALVDAADVNRVRGRCWHLHADPGKPQYARGQFVVGGTKVRIYMHRFLFDVSGKTQVDHKDGDGLNNRRSNLRVATQTQQNANSRLRSDNASGFRGVGRKRGKWRAYIGTRDGLQHLGHFETPIEAAKAYDTAARRIYGDRACLNFPRRGKRGARA